MTCPIILSVPTTYTIIGNTGNGDTFTPPTHHATSLIPRLFLLDRARIWTTFYIASDKSWGGGLETSIMQQKFIQFDYPSVLNQNVTDTQLEHYLSTHDNLKYAVKLASSPGSHAHFTLLASYKCAHCPGNKATFKHTHNTQVYLCLYVEDVNIICPAILLSSTKKDSSVRVDGSEWEGTTWRRPTPSSGRGGPHTCSRWPYRIMCTLEYWLGVRH